MARTPRKPTPEELRWRRSAYDPEKAKRNLRRQYGLLGLWGALTTGGNLRNRRITASKKQF